MNVSSKVPATFKGLSVLEYLATRFAYLPDAAWRQLLQEGRILHNGVLSDGTGPLAQGDLIECDLPAFDAPAVNFDYSIVYEDEWLLGINKPAGLRVHSGGKFVTANLIYHLRHVHQPSYPEATLVNRLDADTSGLLLLARDKEVLRQLMRQFSEGLVDKRYLAVVAGRPSPADGTINLPIGPVEEARVPRYQVELVAGKPSVTHYRTCRRLSDNFTLLELHPATGRTHQLRVHLAAIGHPIAGDALYSMNDNDYLAWRHNPSPQVGLQRQALHSHQLRFFHPVRLADCTLVAPLATDIAQFIQQQTAVATTANFSAEA
jgi:23S rRNA pseudouridine1911/1915/1917 synthase